jgi:hypothetical protein
LQSIARVLGLNQLFSRRRSEGRDLTPLTSRIGADDFYTQLAQLDPVNRTQWQQMVEVQAGFKRAESQYDNPAAVTYSASNRETLHRLAIDLYRDQGPGRVYSDFLRAHPAVFRENGAYRLPPDDQFEILGNTHREMFRLRTVGRLLQGSLREDEFTERVRNAANATRAARRAQGLEVTAPPSRA